MGRRKNYPWNSKVDKKMTKLVSGLIVAPLAAVDTLSKSKVQKKNCNNRPFKVTDKKIKETFIYMIIAVFVCILLGILTD